MALQNNALSQPWIDYSRPTRAQDAQQRLLSSSLLLVLHHEAKCTKSLLWQSIVVFSTELQGISPTTVCQSLKFLVASTCDLPDVINCQFREFAATPLGLVHFLSPHQESGIHCLIICGIQLLTPNNLGEVWRRICSLDIRSVSALEALSNRALQSDMCLLTYWLTTQYA